MQCEVKIQQIRTKEGISDAEAVKMAGEDKKNSEQQSAKGHRI